ncbi:hypothetical protein BTVI_48810 [Pitangus sulphuratus]|nr:hypothetical protein BTVI_48810 [Pitangus sulphuratus]
MGDPHWSSLFLKDCTLLKGPMLKQFVKNCRPWEGFMLEEFVKNCLPWWDPMLEQGKRDIPLGPLTGHNREEISVDPSPSSSPHEEVIDCDEVSPQSPLHQAEQTK